MKLNYQALKMYSQALKIVFYPVVKFFPWGIVMFFFLVVFSFIEGRYMIGTCWVHVGQHP